MGRCLFVIAIVLLSCTGTLRAEDAVAATVERFDSQVGRAREVFERALKSATDATVRQLGGIAERAEKSKNAEEAERACKEILRLDRNQEKARSYFEKQGKLDQILTQLTREWSPTVLPGAPGWETQVFYETTLGTYDDGKIPFVNLAVPNGQNVRTEYVIDTAHTALQGGKTFEIDSYKGTGHFIAPEDGEYVIAALGVMVIDHQTFTDNHTGEPITVRLEAGIHNVSVVSRYELQKSIMEIGNKRTRQKVCVFNSLAEIKQFLETPISGVKPIEVSRWNPDKARPLTIELPGKGK